jgi:hypothetical protein
VSALPAAAIRRSGWHLVSQVEVPGRLGLVQDLEHDERPHLAAGQGALDGLTDREPLEGAADRRPRYWPQREGSSTRLQSASSTVFAAFHGDAQYSTRYESAIGSTTLTPSALLRDGM